MRNYENVILVPVFRSNINSMWLYCILHSTKKEISHNGQSLAKCPLIKMLFRNQTFQDSLLKKSFFRAHQIPCRQSTTPLTAHDTFTRDGSSTYIQLLHLLALLLIAQLKFCSTAPQQAFPSDTIEKVVLMCSINTYEHKKKPELYTACVVRLKASISCLRLQLMYINLNKLISLFKKGTLQQVLPQLRAAVERKNKGGKENTSNI